MQKRVTIKYCERGEYGAGFLLANAPDDFTPGGGLTIAHDVLEHFPKDSGQVHEEAMAFGAILWIRGMNGFFTRNSPGYNMSVDIAMQFREFGDCIPFTKRVNLTEDVDSEIFEWIEEGIKLAWKEMAHLDEDMVDKKAEFDVWCENWRKWCLYGYKKVQQRYKSVESWNLMQVFQDIMEAVDNLRPEYDGQEFIMRYGTNGCHITEKEYEYA
jgi:hypothetical protein